MTLYIRLHAADDVVIARSQLMRGAAIENFQVKGLVPPGHKVAARDIIDESTGEVLVQCNEEVTEAKLEALRDQASAVSLDEEAANMMKFQRAYEANARFFSAVDHSLDTLMQMIGV